MNPLPSFALCLTILAAVLATPTYARALEAPAAPSPRDTQRATDVGNGDGKEDVVPDEAAVRGQVDALIRSFQRQKKKATLGLVRQAIGLSIAYGAPAYNVGDRAACFRFYARTADDLAEAFAEQGSATDPATRALADLKAARERTRHGGSADRNAWAMRYAFDKTQIAWQLEVESAQGLIRLGTDNFHDSRFEEAQDAYESATRSLRELDGLSLEQVPVVCRYAPLALANAMFAQKNYKSASDAVVAGLRYVPEWPAVTIDLRSLHRDPAEYEAVLEDLETKAKAAPEDPALQFLLGYEFYCTGKKTAAREQFERTLKIDPEHAGAKLFLDFKGSPRPGDEPPAQPFTPGESKGAVKT